MEPLPTTSFGDTGLQVTRLGFGTALAGPGKPHWNDETADRLLNKVLDAGINFVDTAYDYVEAERRIGAFLGSRYGEFILATKCGCTDTLPGLNASTHEWTGDNLFRGLEISLKRLRRDRVDVMQLHNPGVAECEAGESRSAFVLRYTLSHPHAHTIIVGTTRPGHLQENVAAVLRGPLPEDVHAEAQRRLDEAGERSAPAV